MIRSGLSAVLLVTFLTLTASCGGGAPPDAAISPLTEPWEQAIPSQAVPAGLATLSATECGQCHQDIYQEWKRSIHAQALADPQFQAEWAKDGQMFVCRNCHTPLQNQQETVVTGLIAGDYHRPVEAANASFDPALKMEAITCAVCHVRDGFVIGPYGNDAPHAVRQDPALLSAQTCLECHNVQGELSPTVVCTFATGDEWQRSPYPARGETCITCHMPEVQRPNVPDHQVRSSNRHTWAGAGIPKFSGVEVPSQPFGGGLSVEIEPGGEARDPGDVAFLTVEVRNERAGHQVPTGDVERFVIVEMRVLSSDGSVLTERRERIGELWEWWPEARRVSDNSLEPGERRAYSLSYTVPDDLADLRVSVIVTNHRMTEANAEAMGILGAYPLSREAFRVDYLLSQDAPERQP